MFIIFGTIGVSAVYAGLPSHIELAADKVWINNDAEIMGSLSVGTPVRLNVDNIGCTIAGDMDHSYVQVCDNSVNIFNEDDASVMAWNDDTDTLTDGDCSSGLCVVAQPDNFCLNFGTGAGSERTCYSETTGRWSFTTLGVDVEANDGVNIGGSSGDGFIFDNLGGAAIVGDGFAGNAHLYTDHDYVFLGVGDVAHEVERDGCTYSGYRFTGVYGRNCSQAEATVDEDGSEAVIYDGTTDTFSVNKNFQITPRTTAPSCGAGQAGQIYFDDSGAFCGCDGSSWINIGGSGTCN